MIYLHSTDVIISVDDVDIYHCHWYCEGQGTVKGKGRTSKHNVNAGTLKSSLGSKITRTLFTTPTPLPSHLETGGCVLCCVGVKIPMLSGCISAVYRLISRPHLFLFISISSPFLITRECRCCNTQCSLNRNTINTSSYTTLRHIGSSLYFILILVRYNIIKTFNHRYPEPIDVWQ